MWRIFNNLFGWQYAEYRDSCNTFVGRVIKTPNNRLRLITFNGVYDALLNDDGTLDGTTGRWRALTW